MSGNGNCYDSAAAETFFKTIKAEMAIFEYINGYYKPSRHHSALGWKALSLLNGRWLKRALGNRKKHDRPIVFP